MAIEYFISLDAALKEFIRTADCTPYRRHCERWGMLHPQSADGLLVQIHRCITARVTMQSEWRDRSRRWLVERGHQPLG